MAKKITGFKTRGMNRDLSVSAFNPEFSFENVNLRLSTNEGNTTLSWVNERGTAPITNNSNQQIQLSGIPIGTAVLNNWLVVFTTNYTSGSTHPATDCIYRMNYNADKTTMTVTALFTGNLNFCTKNPIETQVSYESENIQKVYWVDGRNQPRMINIVGTIDNSDTTQFDFVPTLSLSETITVDKILGGSGMFNSGVIQYCFTYYRKNGQQSNIFYTTPLYYISHKERGARPDERVDNAFKIKVNNVDKRFDYLRIYSIQRTSLEGTPIVKRIQDISLDIAGTSVSYIDTGMHGDTLDPMELLYIGGETVIAGTMDQKDNTLFLGNLKLSRPFIESSLETSVKAGITLSETTRQFYSESINTEGYAYTNQLSSYVIGSNHTVPCSGFKTSDYYRLGVQFQYKTGKWSDPIFLEDKQMSTANMPTVTNGNSKVTVPIFKGVITNSVATSLRNSGYRKARAVVVFPSIQDRVSVCQGVVCPTVYTRTQREQDRNLYAQSSWFFRTSRGSSTDYQNPNSGAVRPKGGSGELPYVNKGNAVTNIREVEIEGSFDTDNRFRSDTSFMTFHSPEIEFDDRMSLLDYTGVSGHKVGNAQFTHTFSDIDIQTETPTASSLGSGFIHKSFSETGPYGVVSGLFYEDFFLFGDTDSIRTNEVQQSPYKWVVYPWNSEGSLNNDINRPADKGVATAVLKKKVISNLRYADTTWDNSAVDIAITPGKNPRLFTGDEVSILKFDKDLYMGNVNTMLIPDNLDGKYFAFSSANWDPTTANMITPFNYNVQWKTFANFEGTSSSNRALWYYNTNGNPPQWESTIVSTGPTYLDLALRKDYVKMKYKSTPHLVFGGSINSWAEDCLPIIEFTQARSSDTRFGGTTEDALRENTWIPCGEPVTLSSSGNTTYYYSYGDTYYQRYDCLKTYAFTREDVNQVVEIGSFMLETRINIDGRYDRNRGQMNNLNMNPTNFNLINQVYSQTNNFFTYKIQNSDYYRDSVFPNQITWSLTKTSGADVDLWTNVTLASMLELDGENGAVTRIEKFNDSLIAFQDAGIAQILYNENVQIASTTGVPIEIANSGKVQGKRYISDTIGCSNKWSIVSTPTGIYFIDSYEKSIYLFNGQLTNLSGGAGMNVWAKNNIPNPDNQWTPNAFENFKSVYDRMNQDILFINSSTSLAWSEKMSSFTSFYDYQGTPYFENFDDTGVWITSNGKLWKHNAGTYCNFFGIQKPYSMTLVGNPEPQTDKIFTNLEMAACIENEGTVSNSVFTPYIPFSHLEVWNEYQHGTAELEHLTGSDAMRHFESGAKSLARKFRLWRCDIPRDNAAIDSSVAAPFSTDTVLGIKRFASHPIDRMRNPWLYMKLYQKADNSGMKTEIHDIIMTYFN